VLLAASRYRLRYRFYSNYINGFGERDGGRRGAGDCQRVGGERRRGHGAGAARTCGAPRRHRAMPCVRRSTRFRALGVGLPNAILLAHVRVPSLYSYQVKTAEHNNGEDSSCARVRPVLVNRVAYCSSAGPQPSVPLTTTQPTRMPRRPAQQSQHPPKDTRPFSRLTALPSTWWAE
jgi:hypothetical protein